MLSLTRTFVQGDILEYSRTDNRGKNRGYKKKRKSDPEGLKRLYGFFPPCCSKIVNSRGLRLLLITIKSKPAAPPNLFPCEQSVPPDTFNDTLLLHLGHNENCSKHPPSTSLEIESNIS